MTVIYNMSIDRADKPWIGDRRLTELHCMRGVWGTWPTVPRRADYRDLATQRMDPVYQSISLQTYLAENEHSVALSHQRAPATARGHQEMDGQAAGQAPLRVDSTAAAFGGARRTRPPSRDAGRAHRGRATWALVPALRLAPCHWAVLSVCWVLGRSGGLSEIR